MLGRRYWIGGELGRGASGVVYRGRDVHSGRPLAVKVLRDGVSGFARHIVTSYAPGRDLREHVYPGRLLPLATVLSIVARAADALARAHARGVVHGDVSPANIVFDGASGRVRLIDFAPRTAGEPLRGTPAYLSPEQLRGMPVGPPADQFSLGAVLYRLACGRLPFCATSRPQLAHAIVNEPHADVRTFDPSIPAALAAVLDRVLAKRPAARFPTAAAFARAIRRVAAGLEGTQRKRA